MKVPAQTPVVLAALSVAGSLASNVDNAAHRRQLTGLPYVISGPEPLTNEQKDAMDALTKGLNGAMPASLPLPKGNDNGNGLPLPLPNAQTPDLPIGTGASNLPNMPTLPNVPGVPGMPAMPAMPQAGKMDPATVAMLIQQNQQLIGLLSAYLPAQAHGGVAGVVTSQLANPASMPPPMGLSGQLQQQIQQVYPQMAGQGLQGLAGFPYLPVSLPMQNPDPWHLSGQLAPQFQAQPNTPAPAQGQGQGQGQDKSQPSKQHPEAKDDDPNFNNGHPWAQQANNLMHAGTPLDQLAPKMPLSQDTLPLGYLPGGQFPHAQASSLMDGIDPSQLTQNLPFAQAGSMVNGVMASGQLAQNLPLSQISGMAGNLPLSQAGATVQGLAGEQLGQIPGGLAGNLPFSQLPQGLPLSQASGMVNGIANGQFGQNLPLGQASGLVGGVTNGQLPAGLPLPLPLPNAGSLVNGAAGGAGGAGGLLSHLLGPLNLQQQQQHGDRKHKHQPTDAVQTGTEMLASATAYMQGGPTGALNVPFKDVGKIGGHQLNQDASADDEMSAASTSATTMPSVTTGVDNGYYGASTTASTATKAAKTATSTWSAPSLVRTSSHASTLDPPATSTAVAYSATSAWSTSRTSAAAADPTSTPTTSASEDVAESSADADGAEGKDIKVRPQRRVWTWIAPRSDEISGRFLPRGNGAGSNKQNSPNPNAQLVAAKANLDPLLHNVLADNPEQQQGPTRTNKASGKTGPGAGRARMAMKKGKAGKNNKEYEDAKDALIKAEASLWEAEHPDGLALAVGDAAAAAEGEKDKKGGKGKKGNSALWAWIGSADGTGTEEDAPTPSTSSKGGKKGKKKGGSSSSSSSTTTTAADATGPSYAFPASMTTPAGGAPAPLISASLTVSAPIRPTLKGSLFGP
ncbi:hypothetical protein OC835_002231 [Tilletia horrida]|nr:hypothetical protein OC835_002231 [Tilletia horrida]